MPLDGEAHRVAPDSWPAEGMRAAASGRVDFDGLVLSPEALVGVRRREAFLADAAFRHVHGAREPEYRLDVLERAGA